ncbi:type IV pili methyl-accepting chemotaxis transducer N-terminal domain-containing protein [Thiopseudomonas denitrificans]|uniref:Sensor protein n=1 Tax=Thiopseudomonas denitrificans TaxID=1501432 RepID=A0A4R6U0M2_9GAMM|nr:type IV pili methyl-accepting chemotaxis transducer N-terminal domain-containing protein [Thiopseudomonas denitrificans]TDQ37835.1 two-component system nitrate/nitrite sensor histidine kinase NarX [Thiopseudomonas denitrificans]
MSTQPEQGPPHEFQISFRHSVILKTLIAFSLVIFFNLLSMLAGMYLAESIRGDAEAINKAGSLRMQSYRLALAINVGPDSQQDANTIQDYIEEFGQTIHARSLVQAVLNQEGLKHSYSQIVNRWQNLMRPLLEQKPPQKRAYSHEVPLFVKKLDDFVHELQLASERKLSYIRGLQISALFITILLALFVILNSHTRLVVPLLKIIAHAKHIGKGNLDQKVDISSKINDKNELGLLAQTLDMMAVELSGLYASLEHKVDSKTLELKKSNDSLKLLFNTAKSLYKTADDPIPALADLLPPIKRTLLCESVVLCLFNLNEKETRKAHTVLTTRQHKKPPYCQYPDCTDCPALESGSGSDCVYSFPLTAEGTCFGYLQVETREAHKLDEYQHQLLTTLADFFAVALNLNTLGQKQARIALMEERAVIARELHDSLAQALSYQKIQLALLKKQLTSGQDEAVLLATFSDLQAGLSAAYRQLRELLSTFRLKLDQPGLAASIDATIKEFSRHTPVKILFDSQIKHCPLTPNEELHSLQIIREALSNVIKHANANTCRISLQQDPGGAVHLLVEDDGIGIDLSNNRSGHYGLSILQERSQSLGGQLDITALHPGTRIHVHFTPQYIFNQTGRVT